MEELPEGNILNDVGKEGRKRASASRGLLAIIQHSLDVSPRKGRIPSNMTSLLFIVPPAR